MKERLTYTPKDRKHKYQPRKFGQEEKFRCFEKLGQLEDIEEELGVDLITLFKALKKSVFLKDTESGIVFNSKENDMGYPQLLYCKHEKEWYIGNDKNDDDGYIDHFSKLKDYGKTWALTKGELE